MQHTGIDLLEIAGLATDIRKQLSSAKGTPSEENGAALRRALDDARAVYDKAYGASVNETVAVEIRNAIVNQLRLLYDVFIEAESFLRGERIIDVHFLTRPVTPTASRSTSRDRDPPLPFSTGDNDDNLSISSKTSSTSKKRIAAARLKAEAEERKESSSWKVSKRIYKEKWRRR